MSYIVCSRRDKTDGAKWIMKNLIGSSKVAYYINDVDHDSREELLRHENLVMRVVQNDR